MKKLIGVDIGGTKVAVGLIRYDGLVEYEVTVPSINNHREKMFELVVNTIKQVLTDLKLSEKEVSLGVGVPGIVDTEKGIAVFQNNLEWSQFPLEMRLQDSFPEIMNIYVDNDVVQAGFAEWKALDLSTTDTMIFMTVSTGISCQLFYGGNVVRGEGLAGEIGLLPVYSNYHSNVERIENIASGPAIARAGKIAFMDESIDAAEIFSKFNKGDLKAQLIVEGAISAIVQGIYALITIVNPSVIVLGGSVIKKNPELLSLIKSRVKNECILIQEKSVESIMISKYDNNAGLIGAALSTLDC